MWKERFWDVGKREGEEGKEERKKREKGEREKREKGEGKTLAVSRKALVLPSA